MSVWLGIVLLSLFCVLLVAWAGHKTIKVTHSDPITFYKDQLAEIEADIDASMISKEDAETASLEIKRRLIKADEKDSSKYIENSSNGVFYGLGALLVSGSIILYMIMGSPEIAGAPYQAPEVMERQISPESAITYRQAIAEIRARLKATPDDVTGWHVLGNTLAGIRRYNEAADAYSHAAVLSPDTADFHLKFGEQITAMHDGQVVPAAKYAFQKVLQLNPNHPGGNFYLGLSQKQGGNKEAARRIWQSLVDRSPPDAPWVPVVQQELADISPVPRTGPTSDDIRAVENMSADEQAAFIDSMLDRLRAKLEENPGDAKGWIMLARSEETRGNIEGAIEALEEGIKSVSEADRQALQLYREKLKN